MELCYKCGKQVQGCQDGPPRQWYEKGKYMGLIHRVCPK